jgi:hypothetical protein
MSGTYSALKQSSILCGHLGLGSIDPGPYVYPEKNNIIIILKKMEKIYSLESKFDNLDGKFNVLSGKIDEIQI